MQERQGQIAGTNALWREAPARGGRPPVLYVHGVPTSGSDWLPFLERAGGYAPDLPGFGRSEMPAGRISIQGFARVIAASECVSAMAARSCSSRRRSMRQVICSS